MLAWDGYSKKYELKPHLKQQWCTGQLTSRFIARMEQILWLYAQSCDSLQPVVCYDERLCFHLREVMDPLTMQSGRVRKEHYAYYTKHGSCSLLAAIEPLTGKRLAQVHSRRTKREFTAFFQALAAAYPAANTIRVMLDNLNTHDFSAFFESLLADEAFASAQRFEFFFTPKSASWLNMIEIELSALSHLCLQRRIPTQEQLASEVLAIAADRDRKGIKINWQFSIDTS